jgi:SNF2 family DNA or RNA helicase
MSQQTPHTGLAKFTAMLEKYGYDQKPHQLDGVAWMLDRETAADPDQGVRGGIVADEMGLGKTIQMIGLMVANFKRRTLIVVPVALLEQWHREIKRATGHSCLIYHGTKKTGISRETLEQAAIVLTTYGHIAPQTRRRHRDRDRDQDRDKSRLVHEIQWDRLIFDEAHHLRNNTDRSREGLAFFPPQAIRWLVTGTPIQNSKSDLFTLCGILGYSLDYYSEEAGLKHIIKTAMLRRTKEGVGIVLPPLTRTNVFIPWINQAERELGQDLHSSLGFANVKNTAAHTHISGAIAETADFNAQLKLLLRARQVCVLPKLMAPELLELRDEGSIYDEDGMMQRGLTKTSKLNSVCATLATRHGNGNNKLVFCHFRGEIDAIKTMLTLEQPSMKIQTFDGRTMKADREAVLTTACDVLILQIQTGCEGLNLQHFNEVYFVSPHWNPAVEDQAAARCHRIGQTKPVEIFSFIMSGFEDPDAPPPSPPPPSATPPESQESFSLDLHAMKVQERKRELYQMIDEAL